MKVTFDKIPHLKPWGMVLGDDIPIKYLSWKHMAKLWKPRREDSMAGTATEEIPSAQKDSSHTIIQ
jgi:hypothetical protein